ncbi:unnamed protein product [Pleuronectes platessa]|uniref:Uncharacterized protein n=1 Tax=Pleuronectes platessa TaxID=8262 RepID=A0A9N7Z3A8_PLEPL|nr:unnamed protein product [Pleuronectes platessa]
MRQLPKESLESKKFVLIGPPSPEQGEAEPQLCEGLEVEETKKIEAQSTPGGRVGLDLLRAVCCVRMNAPPPSRPGAPKNYKQQQEGGREGGRGMEGGREAPGR